MFCVIAKDKEILGVMFKRNLEEERRWQKEELRDLNSPEGMVLYNVDDLRGYDGFTSIYGFKIIRDRSGHVTGITDSEDHPITPQDAQFLDVENYPELVNAISKLW